MRSDEGSVRVGGIVLCGGLSSRMGLPKATLPVGSETMLGRVVRIVDQVVSPIVVVAAPGQTVPRLAQNPQVVHDRTVGRGPLAGLEAGLEAITGHADAVYATSCDVPLLRTAFVNQLVSLLEDHDVVVPVDGKFYHPLAAVYRVGVLAEVTDLLAQDQLRPRFLFDRVRTRTVDVAELREVDPELDSLTNLNHPHDYAAALEKLGLSVPEEVSRSLDVER